MRAGTKGKAVCLDGVDGCGKTSHAISLTAYLRGRGLVAVYLKPLYLYSKGKEEGGGRSLLPKLRGSLTRRAPKLIKFLLTALVVAYSLVVYYLIIARYKRRGYWVICDRYFYYWLILLWGPSAVNYLRLIPKPDKYIVLDVPISENYLRRRIHQTFDRGLSPRYLRRLRASYLAVAKALSSPIIDSRAGFEEVDSRLRREVGL